MINEQPITSTLKPARRTWRFQGFTDFGIDPKIEAFRERVFLTSDGQLDSREQLGQVSRTLSAFKDDQITLSSGKTLTGAELAEATGAFIDKWEAEDIEAEAERQAPADPPPANP